MKDNIYKTQKQSKLPAFEDQDDEAIFLRSLFPSMIATQDSVLKTFAPETTPTGRRQWRKPDPEPLPQLSEQVFEYQADERRRYNNKLWIYEQ